MGIVRDLYMARKIGAGLKLPAPTVASLIKRLTLAKILYSATEKTETGVLIHIEDALAEPALAVVVNIAPVQSGSGDPSPDNVRPISGITGLSVYVSPTNDVDDATVYALDWTSQAGTVYGGTIDIVTGVLTVDWAYVDMGTLEWIKPTATNFMNFQSYGIQRVIKLPPSTSEGYKVVLCSTYESTLSSGGDCYIYSTNDGRLRVKDTANASLTAEQFKTLMDGVQLVYELATPATYQLTAQEVQMLLGENYIWSSSGDSMSVTYMADGNATPLDALNLMLGNRYSNPGTVEDVSDREALNILLGR